MSLIIGVVAVFDGPQYCINCLWNLRVNKYLHHEAVDFIIPNDMALKL